MMKKNKKCLSVLLALVLTLLSGSAVFAARSGDINGDDLVSAADARLALRAAVGLETFASGSAEFIAADANRDGVITAADARILLRVSVGLHLLSSVPETVQSTFLRGSYLRDYLTPTYSRSYQFTGSYEALGIQTENQVVGAIPDDIQGVLSAFVDDFDGDSLPELLLVRLAPNSTYYSTQVELYRIKGNTAVCTLTLPIYGGIGNALDQNNKVYLMQKNDVYYICDAARLGGTASRAENAYRLQVHRINANDTYTTLIDLYSSTLNGSRFNETSVTDAAAAISANKTLFASVGLEGITAANYMSFPSNCGRLFECGTYGTEKVVKVIDYSGFLADS